MSAAHGEQVRVLEEHGQQEGRSLNWWGMSFFIASEALIFANLIAVFLYLYVRDGAHWVLPESEIFGSHVSAAIFPAGVNTVILLSSSLFMHMAGSGIRKGNQRRLIGGLIGTITLGALFLAGQVYEYIDFYGQKFMLTTETKGSAFYTITGFHGLHVTIGALFLIVVLVRSLRGDFTAKNHFAVEAAEMYWHFVDAVWIFVFSVVYLLPLLRG